MLREEVVLCEVVRPVPVKDPIMEEFPRKCFGKSVDIEVNNMS